MTKNVFNQIKREHILAAIDEIDKNEVRKGRHSSTYDIIYNNQPYPPKYVLSLAALYAMGRELEPSEFEGGIDTPAFILLEELNFRIAPKVGTAPSFWYINFKHVDNVLHDDYIRFLQKNNQGSANPTSQKTRRTSVGDIVFPYTHGTISAIGEIADLPSNQIQQINIQWQKLLNPLILQRHLKETELSTFYQETDFGEINSQLGNKLLSLIELTNNGIKEAIADINITLLEKAEEKEIERASITNTQKQQLIMARVGQGEFRFNVQKIESKCRVTGLTDKRFLIASHIKPWKDSSNEERLDGHNGLLLSPHIDKLFDKGWISFSNDGRLLFSNDKILPILKIWSIDFHISIGTFTDQQKVYLNYHRVNIFKQ